MSKTTIAGITVGVITLLTTGLVAQGTRPVGGEGSGPAAFMILYGPNGMVPAIERLGPMPMQGTIIEISCFRKMGAASVSSPEQIACARAAVAAKVKGIEGAVGILSDGDGVFKIVGGLTANNHAKLVPLIGRRVDVQGTEVILSNNFDYRAYEVWSVKPAKP